MAKILVIDDERAIRDTLKEILEYEKHEVTTASNGAEGLEQLKSATYDIALCDIKMPQMDGIEVLQKIVEISPDTQVIMISGHGNIDTAVEAIRKGAYDFIEKPLDLNRILVTIKNACDKTSLITETRALKHRVIKNHELVGHSQALTIIREMIEKVAPTEAKILITGENGTGKEVVARLIHEKSKRAAGPFVEVNCAAIPGELIESELFGHEKGAFTSAMKQRKGKFEQAHGGTLFLDEIGDMSLAAQSKVLRALQENKIQRVGGEKEIEVDVRIIAATNKDLSAEIQRGNFREDLYHRLSVIVIKVPSLNQRAEDIPELTEYFLRLTSVENNMALKKITPEAVAELQKIKWTGNIREFRNMIERLIILCGPVIDAPDVIRYASPVNK